MKKKSLLDDDFTGRLVPIEKIGTNMILVSLNLVLGQNKLSLGNIFRYDDYFIIFHIVNLYY